jgi:hypothetical protein
MNHAGPEVLTRAGEPSLGCLLRSFAPPGRWDTCRYVCNANSQLEKCC